MGLFSKRNKIENWNPGYYPDISNANRRQIESFSLISSKIRAGEYLDVGENAAYLLCFGYEINKHLCSGEKAYFNTAVNDYRSYISLYGKERPQLLIYAFPWLLFSEIMANVPKNVISKDFEAISNLLIENSVYGYGYLLTALYIKALNITPSSNVPTTMLKVFVGSDLKQYLTDTGKDAYDAVVQNAYAIVERYFEEERRNYLYEMFDFEDGIIAAQQQYNLSYESKEKYHSYGIKNTDFSAIIPIANNKRDRYCKALMREAENMYRKNSGLQAVGEGWVSETFLFRQIEAAFPNVTVKQHESPSFLGRQHYDIYIPEHKIALEYQGEQHYTPIDIFGGEEGLKSSQARDRKKRQLSTKNNVKLIEVFPGYEISTVIHKILNIIYGDDPHNEKRLHEALSRAESAKYQESDNGVLNSAVRNFKKEIQK